MATKKRQRFTKWRISDVVEAVIAGECGDKVCPDATTFTRRAAGVCVVQSLRAVEQCSPRDAILTWYLYLPWALGIDAVSGDDRKHNAEVQRVAAHLVAEARRLNVPMRAR